MMWRLAGIRSHSILRNNGRFSIHLNPCLTHRHSLYRQINAHRFHELNANSYTKLKRNFQPFDVHICLNPLSPLVLNSIVYVYVCISLNGWNRGWVKSERWQIAYCRKINTICNSSREHFSIQSFSVITWRLNGTFIFIAAVQLNYIHYLLEVRYFKVLTQKCRIIRQLALCFFAFSFTHSICHTNKSIGRLFIFPQQ